MDSLTYVLSEEICKAVREVGPVYGVTNIEGFATDILVYMGIQTRSAGASIPMTPEKKTSPVVPDAPKKVIKEDKKEEDKKEEDKKGRARTISKKMKEVFIGLGGSEEQLKEITKKYKVASDVDIEAHGGSFEGFARDFLGLEKKNKNEKKEKKKERITWTPTPKKMFKEIVEASGGAYTDDLKIEFTDYLNGKTDDDFKTLSVEGHMRVFAVGKFAPPSPTLHRHDAEVQDTPDEEDLEEFTYEDETLMIGLTTGKIYRTTEEAGDVLIGIAGQGRFASVKIPYA
jgi:hypothetical protein